MKREIVSTQLPPQGILIVEDDEAIRDLLVTFLEQETALRAFAVSDASQAYQVVQSVRPRLLILDYGLPGMNGLQLHDLLHSLAGLETVPTLMISAFAPSRQAMRDLQITCLNKPFDLDLLKHVITNLLAQRR